MSQGLDNLQHIVVLMMENRSFDHLLGALKAVDPRINGLTGNESNLDTTNEPAKVMPLAEWQSQLDPDPDHHFPTVHKQLYYGAPGPPAVPSMNGFVQSYYDQQKDVNHSRKIMYYFPNGKLPVLQTLAQRYALFNGWFASIPGPTICNRAFAHYGTSFGQVSMDMFYENKQYKSIYERLIAANPQHTTKLYYYDTFSSTMEIVNLLKNQPQIFGTYQQFLSDCANGQLPDYCFVCAGNFSQQTGILRRGSEHNRHRADVLRNDRDDRGRECRFSSSTETKYVFARRSQWSICESQAGERTGESVHRAQCSEPSDCVCPVR